MPRLTSFDLKIVASMSMFLDHFGAIFIYQIIVLALNMSSNQNGLVTWTSEHLDFMIQIYQSLRIIGRIAFPIYCFLLVEGFFHTRSILKYGSRLFVFALLSEIPFDLAFHGQILEYSYNNVFFTLFLGLLTIWILSIFEKQFWLHENLLIRIGIVILAVGCVCLIGRVVDQIVCSDYGFSGILCIVLMYIFRKQKMLGFVLGVLATVFVNASQIQLWALMGIAFISLYHGEKGKSMKYFFYGFYPLHLMFIYGISRIFGLF